MIEYTAEIEWLCEHAGILRLWRSPARPGDQGYWSVFLHRWGHWSKTVTFKAASSAPPLHAMRAINDTLYAEGIERRRYLRRKNGVERWVDKEVLPPRRGEPG